MDSKSIPVKVAKYFAHGLLFSFLTYVMTFALTFLEVFLVVTMALAGLVLAFVLLAIVYGFVNTKVTQLLWFPMRKGWKVYLAQGFTLFLALFFVEFLPVYALIPLYVELAMLDQVILALVLLVVYGFASGYIGKYIGGHWRVLGVKTEMMERTAALIKEVQLKPNNPSGVRCPRCGGANLVVAGDHSAYCIDCKRGLRREVLGHPSQ